MPAPRRPDRRPAKPRAPRQGAARAGSPSRSTGRPASVARGGGSSRQPAPSKTKRDLPELERWLVDELHAKAAHHRRADAKQRMQELAAAAATGDVAEAIRAAERAKGAAPHAPSVREALGLLLYESADFHRALAELRAYRRMTGSRTHDPRIADCYRADGRPEKAIELLETLGPAEVDEETWIDGLIVRAEATAETGNLAGAVAVLAAGPLEAGEIHDRHRRLWYAYADMLARSGRDDEARRWFVRVGVESPDDSDAPERAKG